MKLKSRTLKVAICIDPNGTWDTTADEEFEDLQKAWKLYLKPHKAKFYRATSAYPGAIQSGTDLILFDYGGMGYGNDLAERNSQNLIQYCVDNPNTLALVISSYTWNTYVKYIMHDFQFDELANLKVVEWSDDPEKYVPEWFMKGVNPPESIKGVYCQVCNTNLIESSRKNKELTKCTECKRLYCNLCEWGKVVKGIDYICADCGERHYESI